MSSTNLALMSLLVLLTTNGTLTSTQLFLLIALLTTCACTSVTTTSET